MKFLQLLKSIKGNMFLNRMQLPNNFFTTFSTQKTALIFLYVY